MGNFLFVLLLFTVLLHVPIPVSLLPSPISSYIVCFYLVPSCHTLSGSGWRLVSTFWVSCFIPLLFASLSSPSFPIRFFPIIDGARCSSLAVGSDLGKEKDWEMQWRGRGGKRGKRNGRGWEGERRERKREGQPREIMAIWPWPMYARLIVLYRVTQWHCRQ